MSRPQSARALYFSAWIAIASSACRSSAPIDRSSTATTNANATGAASDDAGASAEPTAPASDAGTSASDASPADSGAAPSALERQLRAMVASDDAFVAAILPTRGLSVIEYLEAPPSGRGRPTRRAEQLCGAALRQRARGLRDQITQALTRAADGQDILCEAEECTVPGMEYEATKRFRFILADDGAAPRLESIEFVSEATMGDAWLNAARTHTNTALATHRRTTCRTP